MAHQELFDDLIIFLTHDGAGGVDQDAARFDQSGRSINHHRLNLHQVLNVAGFLGPSQIGMFAGCSPARAGGIKQNAIERLSGELGNIAHDRGNRPDAHPLAVFDQHFETLA